MERKERIMTMDEVRTEAERLKKEKEEGRSLQERIDNAQNIEEKITILRKIKAGEYLILGRTYHVGATERFETEIETLENYGFDIGIENSCEFTYCILHPIRIIRGESGQADDFMSELRVYRRPLTLRRAE